MNMKKNLKQLFEEYIDECQYSRGLRLQTIRASKLLFKHFFKIMPEVVEVESLTVEMMNEFFKRIKTRTRIVGRNTPRVGLKDSTIKTYGNKISGFFVWLKQRNLILYNPMDNIKLKNPEYNDQRALKEDEINKILAAITLHTVSPLIVKRDMLMVHVLTFCGLRANEFISLRVADINMERKMLTVRAETSKSKKTRDIPMNPTLVFYLEEYIKERNKHGYKTEDLLVSSNEDKGLSRHGLKHWVNKYIKLSGVKFHLHRFRHTFATKLAKGNTGVIKIQKLMGHADIRMTMGYVRSIAVEDCREDIDRLTI